MMVAVSLEAEVAVAVAEAEEEGEVDLVETRVALDVTETTTKAEVK
jgi:hypothetical protein